MLFRIQLSEWVGEKYTYYMTDEAFVWTKRELERNKDFIAISVNKYSPETSIVILQD
jgi:hypothetical protein